MKWLISRSVLRSNGAKTMQNVGNTKFKRIIHRECKDIRCECKAVLNILLLRIQWLPHHLSFKKSFKSAVFMYFYQDMYRVLLICHTLAWMIFTFYRMGFSSMITEWMLNMRWAEREHTCIKIHMINSVKIIIYSRCMLTIKSTELEVNLHNEEMKGNEMTANYL